jgi:excisionase family DNA binding protein
MFKRALQHSMKEQESSTNTAPNVLRMTMTVDEMAAELNISRPTAYELVKQEHFPAFHIGQRILVNRAGLQRWIDEQCGCDRAA